MMERHCESAHIQLSRKWGSGENVIASWKDGGGMQAVEIEATVVHQTPSGQSDVLMHQAQISVSLKCT